MRGERCGATPLEQLCDVTPWSGDPRGPIWSWTVGVWLGLGRLLLAVLAAPVLLMLPGKLSRRLFLAVRRALGVTVVCNLDQAEVARLTDGCIVAASHVSVLDLLAVCSQPQACILIAEGGGPPGSLSVLPLARGGGADLWRVSNKAAFARRFARWRKAPAGRCLYVCPEQTIGNQQGLFRFHPTFLARGLPVVPLAIRVTAPFGVRADPISSPKPVNFFRLLGLPGVRFNLDFLPRMAALPGEAPADFARRVQAAIADHLQIPATDWSPGDKRALRLRLRSAAR